MIDASLILDIVLILLTGWVFGSAARRIGQPVMVGQLLAGVLLGPPVLGWVQPSEALEVLAELGIFFVMFHTGMELSPKRLFENIVPATAVAIGGFFLPFGMGVGICLLFGGTLYQALFVGMGISITAIAVQSIVLHELKLDSTDLGHVIIGAAVADDLMAMVGLGVLLGFTRSGAVELNELLWVFAKTIAFFGVTFCIGRYVVPLFRWKWRSHEAKAFTFSIIVALSICYLAELAGLHLVIGAFLAGQFLRKTELVDDRVHEIIRDRFFGLSYGCLVPIFFATLSFHLTMQFSFSFLFFLTMVTVVAFLGKVLGCGIGYYSVVRHAQESLIVGCGMSGRGAVELVIAAVVMRHSDALMHSGVISTPLLTEEQFTALIVMGFLTTLAAPISLRWAAGGARRAEE